MEMHARADSDRRVQIASGWGGGASGREEQSDASGAHGRWDGGGVALAVLTGVVGGQNSVATGWG